MDFDINRILRLVSHRPPFVLVDRVTELQPGKSARAFKCVTASEPHLAGHAPGRVVLPPILLVEALAQLTGIVAYAAEPYDLAAKTASFVGIDSAKFRHPAGPGDRVSLEVEVKRHRSNIWKTQGVASIEDTICVEAEVLVAILDWDELPGGTGG